MTSGSQPPAPQGDGASPRPSLRAALPAGAAQARDLRSREKQRRWLAACEYQTLGVPEGGRDGEAGSGCSGTLEPGTSAAFRGASEGEEA